jgi:hypothetical protein
MRVVNLKGDEELHQKDYMQLDMIYVYRVPPGSYLLLDLTRYKGGETKQENA